MMTEENSTFEDSTPDPEVGGLGQVDVPPAETQPTGEAWSARPSIRPYILGAILIGAMTYAVSLFIGPAFQSVINATLAYVAWTESIIENVYYACQTIIWLPLALVGLKAIGILVTKYSIEDGRLIYDHGLVFRKRDQIALQRVRDFRVLKPVSQRIVWTGTVLLVSRDETYPELAMGPFPDPVFVSELIRDAVLAQQASTNYREFEST